MISICGKAGSHAVREIVKNTNLIRYNKNCIAVVNYGLAGKRLDIFRKKFPSVISKPTINRNVGESKYKAVKRAEKIGILVPESYLRIPIGMPVDNFIVKKFNSQGGKGIVKANNRNSLPGRYYQKFISNRRYELRVHGFKWVDKSEWLVQKRIGDPSKIAWNFSAGGTFHTIRNKNTRSVKQAIDITAQVLKMMEMGFGAADFILNDKGELFFIEMNSAPGFENLSKPFYIYVFNALCSINKNNVLSYTK